MDERQLDRLIQAKLLETEGERHAVSGWAHVASSLPPSAIGWWTNWRSKVIVAGGLLLLISNLVLIGVVLQQQKSLDNISDHIRQIEALQTLNRQVEQEQPQVALQESKLDEVVLSQPDGNNTHSDALGQQRNFAVVAPPTSNQATQKILPNTVLVDPYVKPIPDTVSSPRELPDSIFVERDQGIMEIDTIRETALSENLKPTSSLDTITESIQPEIAKQDLKKVKRRRRKPLRTRLTGGTWQTGLNVFLPRTNIDLGIPDQGTGTTFGLGVEYLAPSDRLRLSSGIEYGGLAYKTDDHVHAPDIAGKYTHYPDLEQYGILERLHEIDMHAKLIEVPIKIKYILSDRAEIKPWISAGAVGRFFLKQDFLYEFENTTGEDVVFTEMGMPSRSWGIGELAVGGEYQFSKKWKGQLALMYRLDLAGHGVEQRRYQFWGIQAGFWRHWGKKKKY